MKTPHQSPSQAVALSADKAEKCPVSWPKRLAFLTFMFFLIKGLLWLAIPGAIVAWQML